MQVNSAQATYNALEALCVVMIAVGLALAWSPWGLVAVGGVYLLYNRLSFCPR